MASAPGEWPFLAVLMSRPPAMKGDAGPQPARTRGLGYVLGEILVTLEHVAERAEFAFMIDGSEVPVSRLAGESGLAVMGLAEARPPTARLGDLSRGESVTVAIVSDYEPRVRLVPGRAGRAGPDGTFTVELDGPLPEDHTASGSPVFNGKAVVGIVGPTATNVSVDAYTAQTVLQQLGPRYPDLTGTGSALSAETRAALGYAAEIAEVAGAPAAVLLGVLWSGENDPTLTVASELHSRVEVSIGRVTEELGVAPPERPEPASEDELRQSPIGPLLAAAEDIRSRAGAGRIHRRHLLLAALSRPPTEFPQRMFEALGLSPPELRRALRESLATRHEDERRVWERLLADPYDLAGGVAADFVDPEKGIAPEDDRLSLNVDVTMFAALIADVKTPMPLSVGLFGEWGSGKSYFMGLLRHQVETLSRSSDPRYRSEIVQIGFNAWHYADSNLWASLGDEIFEELARPHKDSGDARRAKLRDELADRLQHRQELQAATDRAQAETVRLTTALDEARAARRTSAADVAAAALQAPELQKELGQAWERLGAGDPREQVRLLAGELEQAPEDVRGVRRAVAGVPRWMLLAGVVVAIAAIAAGIWASQLLAGAGVTLLALVTAAGAVAARVRSGARLLHEIADGLRRRQDAAVADELEQLRQAETSERVLQAQLDEAIGQVGELTRELAELTPGRRLYSFVAERAASDVYRGQLGLISTIRKDFEELNVLMGEWRAEKSADDAKRPIDRIVLYIDDLDRCSPEQVVEVLQAVHLLLALDLFVVVVGVDPRWLLHSLRREYRSMITTRTKGAGGDPRWETTPQDYLEKIFNIPFALPRMNPTSFKQLVDSFAETESDEETALATAEPPPRPTEPAEPAEAPEEVEPSVEPTAQPVLDEAAATQAEARSEVAALQAGVEEPERRPLTSDELTMLAALAPLVGTPRETKRLVNLYRMMRSTRDLSPASRFLGDDDAPGEYQAVVILLGLLSGHARLLHDVLVAPAGEDVGGGLRGRPSQERWADFAAGLAPRADGDGFKNDVIGAIPADDVDEWTRLADGLEEVGKLVTIPDLTPFQVWAPRIARFSFLLSPYADESEKP